MIVSRQLGHSDNIVASSNSSEFVLSRERTVRPGRAQRHHVSASSIAFAVPGLRERGGFVVPMVVPNNSFDPSVGNHSHS